MVATASFVTLAGPAGATSGTTPCPVPSVEGDEAVQVGAPAGNDLTQQGGADWPARCHPAETPSTVVVTVAPPVQAPPPACGQCESGPTEAEPPAPAPVAPTPPPPAPDVTTADLDCGDPGVGTNIPVGDDDPNRFDDDGDGVGCEEVTPAAPVAVHATPTTTVGAELPRTGSTTAPTVAVGAGLLAVGVGAVAAGRKLRSGRASA
jgi:hypothetical protein